MSHISVHEPDVTSTSVLVVTSAPDGRVRLWTRDSAAVNDEDSSLGLLGTVSHRGEEPTCHAVSEDRSVVAAAFMVSKKGLYQGLPKYSSMT